MLPIVKFSWVYLTLDRLLQCLRHHLENSEKNSEASYNRQNRTEPRWSDSYTQAQLQDLLACLNMSAKMFRDPLDVKARRRSLLNRESNKQNDCWDEGTKHGLTQTIPQQEVTNTEYNSTLSSVFLLFHLSITWKTTSAAFHIAVPLSQNLGRQLHWAL